MRTITFKGGPLDGTKVKVEDLFNEINCEVDGKEIHVFGFSESLDAPVTFVYRDFGGFTDIFDFVQVIVPAGAYERAPNNILALELACRFLREKGYAHREGWTWEDWVQEFRKEAAKVNVSTS